MKENGGKKRVRECVFLSILCAGSLFGIYIASIGPVMLAASKLEQSGSKLIDRPSAKARAVYQPWYTIYSHCPEPVQRGLDSYVELWFRSG